MGLVGEVPQVRAKVVLAAGSLVTSSAWKVDIVAGVIPAAAGRPSPIATDVAVVMVKPISMILGERVEVAIISHMALLMVTFDVRTAIEYIPMVLVI